MEIKYFKREFLYTDEDNLDHRNVIYYRVINDNHVGGINTKFNEVSTTKCYCTAKLVESDGDIERACTPLEIEWMNQSFSDESYIDFNEYVINETRKRLFSCAHTNTTSDENLFLDNYIYTLTKDNTNNTTPTSSHPTTGDQYIRTLYHNNHWTNNIDVKKSDESLAIRYKKDDYVVCLPQPVGIYTNSGNYLLTGGFGYKPNLCFKITKANDYNNYKYKKYQVLWADFTVGGIFSNSVRPATVAEIEYYNKVGLFDITRIPESEAPVNNILSEIYNSLLKKFQNENIRMEIKYFRRDFLYTDEDNIDHRNVIYYRVINDNHVGGINTKFREVSASEDCCTASLDLDDSNTERACTPLEIEWMEQSFNNNIYIPLNEYIKNKNNLE